MLEGIIGGPRGGGLGEGSLGAHVCCSNTNQQTQHRSLQIVAASRAPSETDEDSFHRSATKT